MKFVFQTNFHQQQQQQRKKNFLCKSSYEPLTNKSVHIQFDKRDPISSLLSEEKTL